MLRKIILIVFTLILIITLPLAINFGKTGKNTTVLGKDYSLLKKADIITRLRHDFPLPESIILKSDDREFILPLASVSAKINYSQVSSNLLFRRLNRGIRQYLLAFFQPKNFSLTISYNQQQLTREIQQIASQIDHPFVPTEITLSDKKQIITKPGQLGQSVDIQALQNQIISSLTGYKFSFLSIPLNPVGQLPAGDKISSVISTAEKLIGKFLKLTYADQSITLEDNVLINWLDFDSLCNADKINDYVKLLKTNIKKDPVDAVLKFENNQVTEFRSAQDGYSLSDSELVNQICPKIKELISSDSDNVELKLPLLYTPPKISTGEANNLGIKELLGTGVSTFKHSTAIRNFNVEKGASIVNRLLVAPGDTFSFIKALGEVTLEAGYKKAYIIRQGKTELDVGGGICQVSTTFFRALLNSGLDITQRQNHAYRVQYYEEDMPPGYDATVFIPNPDLKFVNDTGHYLLIQSTYDGVNKKLTYEIYGTSDGRKVEITNYRQWGAAPPPPDVYIDDPTLPPGKVVQDEHRIPGLKTAFDWKVTRGEEILHQKTFQSSYVPWAAVYRRGPAL